ncbi:MAG TPA: hypothetical protein VG268_16270 [Streptosporangiaceae bacterium]|nr:hypothetical protein [Streptosporangiaceae bacterium]
MTVRPGSVLILVATLMAAALSACSSPPKQASGTASVVSAPVRVARTKDGPVGYRVVGTAIAEWKGSTKAPAAVNAEQNVALSDWDAGHDPAGHAFLFQDWASFAQLVNSFR